MKYILLLALCWPCCVFADIHINCGGGVSGGYSSDQYYTGGTNYAASITMPAGMPDYLRTSRGGTFPAGSSTGGNFSYRFPVADGNYTVTLRFAETSAAVTTRGQRVFAVTINGAVVLPALDIWAAVGLNKEYVQTFTVLASGGNGITATFQTLVRNAVVSAIDVVPIPIAEDKFPGCATDGQRGIKCEGGVTLGGTTASPTGAILLGGADGGTVGFAAADGPTGGGVVLLVLKFSSDPTGKSLTIGGAIPCPQKLHPSVIAMGPVCFEVVLK